MANPTGRPKQYDRKENKTDVRLSVMMTKSMRQSLEELSGETNMTVGWIVRQCIAHSLPMMWKQAKEGVDKR